MTSFFRLGNYESNALATTEMEKCVLEFKVVPRASNTGIANAVGDIIRIRIAAPPEQGKANKELLRFLAKRLGVPKANVEILTGKTSRRKRVTVEGLSEEKAHQVLLNSKSA